MTQPEKSYSVRVFVEGIGTVAYRSLVWAEGPLQAIHQELETIERTDPAGLEKCRYGAVITAEPIE